MRFLAETKLLAYNFFVAEKNYWRLNFFLAEKMRFWRQNNY